MNRRPAALAAVLFAATWLGMPLAAWAQERGSAAEQRELAIGVAAHLLAAIGDSCRRDEDVVECTDFVPFAGADLSAHYFPVDFFALGVRLSGSRDLDSAQGASSDGVSWDPEDQWLWRASIEARLDPPLLPAGLWVSGELGGALLREVQQSHAGTAIREDAASRGAPLLGLGVGWDFWLGRSLTLAPEVRLQALLLGDAPELRAGVDGRDYGSAVWAEATLRLSYVP